MPVHRFRRVFVIVIGSRVFYAPYKHRSGHVLARLRYFVAKPFSTSTVDHKNKTPNFRQSVERYFLTSVSAQASASVNGPRFLCTRRIVRSDVFTRIQICRFENFSAVRLQRSTRKRTGRFFLFIKTDLLCKLLFGNISINIT